MPAAPARMNLPNIITLVRLVAIPVLVVVFYLPFQWSHVGAAAVFLGAGLTDMLDGYLARRLGLTSPFGAFLDPVADKLMVATALVMLVQAYPGAWMVVPVVIIVAREITVSALREWMAELGERAQVAVSGIGKAKTVAQMVAITALLALQPAPQNGDLAFAPVLIGAFGLLYIATGLTLWSMVAYLRAAWPLLWARADRDH